MHPVTFHDTKRQSLTLWTSREVYREPPVQASLVHIQLERGGPGAGLNDKKAWSPLSNMPDNARISHLRGFWRA